MNNKKNIAYHVRFNFDSQKPLIEKNYAHHLSLFLPLEEETITPIRKKPKPTKHYEIMISSCLGMFFIAQSLQFIKCNPLEGTWQNANGIISEFRKILEILTINISNLISGAKPKHIHLSI